jgi:hypothetical protein
MTMNVMKWEALYGQLQRASVVEKSAQQGAILQDCV